MVGNIITNTQFNNLSGTDRYLDINTCTCTENQFLNILEDKLFYKIFVGLKVQLSNSTIYNNGVWIIVDLNHDSTNTGQTNCYDLLPETYITDRIEQNTTYRSSSLRTWLNTTYYNGFNSKIKSHIIKPKYQCGGTGDNTWYNDDYIILPSYREIGYTNHTYYQQYDGQPFSGNKFINYNNYYKDFTYYGVNSFFVRSYYYNNSSYFAVYKYGTGVYASSSSYASTIVPLLRIS